MILNFVGKITECFLLSYRTPIDDASRFVPKGMRLITYKDWAFWNLLVCKLEQIRPHGFPSRTGISYHHVAYRLLVSAITEEREEIRGIHFLRSDVDRWRLTRIGNYFTDFRLHPAKIKFESQDKVFKLDVKTSDGIGNASVSIDLSKHAPKHENSCFIPHEEASKFLKYSPTGLASNSSGKTVRLAEVFRNESKWIETPVRILDSKWSFFQHHGQRNVVLEQAIQISPIDYQWQVGRQFKLSKSN